jgi:predicted PurR-regulated permease PerM
MKMPLRSEDPGVAAEQKSASLPISAEPVLFHQPLNARSFALSGIFLLLALYTLKIASAFFIPVIVAILLKFLFASVIRGLARFYIPPPLAAVFVIIAMLGILGFGIYQIASPAGEWMGKLPQTVRQVERKLKGVRQSVEEVNRATKEVDRLTTMGGPVKTQQVEVRKPSLGESLVAPTQEFIVSLGIVIILLYFLLASEDMLLRKLVTVLPRLRNKKIAVEISRQIEQDVSIYLITITVINTLFGLSVGVAMYFLGLPTPYLWGVMAGLLHYIPFLGAVIGISIVTLVAAVTLGGINEILMVPAVYLGLNLLEEYVLLPLVMGRRLMLNPVIVLVWMIFWAWLWGVRGALMAVPLLAIVKIMCDRIEPLAPFGEFISR